MTSMPKVLKYIASTVLAFASFSTLAASYKLPNNNLPGCSKSGNTYTCPNGLNLSYRDRVQISGNNSVVINVSGNVNLGSEMRINENGSAQQLTITTTGSFNGGAQTVINANISSQQSITLANENDFSGSLVAVNDVSVGFRTNTDGPIQSTNASVILQGENTITGNVDAENNVIVRFLTEVTGNITARNGNVILEGQNEVTGSIFSGGNTILRFRSDVDGDITSKGRVVLEGENQVDGNVIADDDVTLRYGADVNGDIEADGRVTLEGENIVDGNINASDRVTVPNSSTVTGYVNAPQIIDESNVEGETCDINSNQGPCVNEPPDQSLDGLGFWTLDQLQWQGQPNEVLDLSGNGLHGQALRGANTSSFNPVIAGSPGTCRYGIFNGDNVVRVDNASSIANAESIAVAFWFKGSASRQNQSESYQTLLVMGNGPTEGNTGRFEVYRQDTGDGGGLYFEIRRNNGQIVNVEAGNAQQGQANLLDDEWHHLAASYDRASRRLELYIDGQLVDQRSFNGSPNLNSVIPRLHIGGQATADNSFNGEIDEVFIDDRAFTESEVNVLKDRARPCNDQRPLCEDVWPQAFDVPNTVPQPFDLPDRSYNTQLPAQLQPTDYLRTGNFGDVGANYTTNGETSRVYIDGNLTIQNGRRINTGGDADELILIITGDLTLERNVEINGYIYVQGDLLFERSEASQTEVTGGLSVGGSSRATGGTGAAPEVTYVPPVSPINGGQFCSAEPPQQESPILKWRMNSGPWDGSAGEVLDDSGNGLNGTTVNNPDWFSAGEDSALPTNSSGFGTCGYGYFDNNQQNYIELEDTDEIDFETEFTIGLWIKPESYPESGLMTILSKDENYEFHLNSDGTINWWWNRSDGSVRQFNSNSSVPRNVWSYVAIRYRNGEQTIFINGARAGSENYTGLLRTNQDSLQLGSDQNFAGRYFDGFLDEVTIFNTALSDLKISELQSQRVQCSGGMTSDYYRVEFNSPALTCSGAEVTVKACNDSNCETLSNQQSTVGLSLATGADGWSENPLTFTGQGSTQLKKYQPGKYQLSLINTDPSLSNEPRCFVNGVETQDCLIQFNATGFIFTNGPELTNTNMPKQTSGVPYDDLYLQAVELDPATLSCQSATANVTEVEVSMRCLNPGTCSNRNTFPQAIMSMETDEGSSNIDEAPSFSSLPVNFGGGNEDQSQEKITINFGDVGEVQLEAKAELPNGRLVGVSESFVWQPHSIGVQYENPQESFSDSDISARAGTPISVTLTPLNAYGSITPNFGNELAEESLKLAQDVTVSEVGETAGELTGYNSFTPFELSPGLPAYRSSQVIYKEVGKPSFKAVIESGDYLSGVHSPSQSPVHNFSPGRYIPAEFKISSPGFTNRCEKETNSFFYIEQKQKLQTVTRFEAVNALGEVTENYDSSLPYVQDDFLLEFYAFNLDSDSGSPIPDSTQLSSESSTNIVWNDGIGSFESSEPFVRYKRETTCANDEDACPLEGPYKDYHLGIQINDGEGGEYYSTIADSSLSNVNTARPYYDYGSARLVFGRFKLTNISGAVVDPLAIEGRAEFWNGNQFVTNTDDSCTVVKAVDFNDNVETDDIDVNLQPASGSEAILSQGRLQDPEKLLTNQFAWLAPESAKTSNEVESFTFEVNVLPFLEYDWDADGNYEDDPQAEGTFGIYRGSDRQIYWQEIGW